MGSFLLTLIGALILMVFVVGCLAIGKLLTGKHRLKRGTCGMIPKKGKEKASNCSICGAEKPCDTETDNGKAANDDNDNADRKPPTPQ